MTTATAIEQGLNQEPATPVLIKWNDAQGRWDSFYLNPSLTSTPDKPEYILGPRVEV